MFAQDKLDLILRRHQEIGEKLSGGPDSQSFVALSRELASLDEVAAAIGAYRAARKEVDELRELLADPSTRRGHARLGQGRDRGRGTKARRQPARR